MNVQSSYITNNQRNYDILNFKKYHNFYTLLQDNICTYKRVYNISKEDWIIHRYVNYETLVIYKDFNDNIKPSFIVLGIKNLIKPIYGHFATNNNFFIYTNVNAINYKPIYNVKYLKNPLEKLLKPVHSQFYKFTDVEDLKHSYKIIKDLEFEKYKENIKDKIEQIIIDNNFFKDLYVYENEKITSLIESKVLNIYLHGKKIEI